MSGAPREKLEWILASQERLKSLSSQAAVPRRAPLSPDQFLNQHYALNAPVVIAGELAIWPALSRWDAHYLKARVGAAPVEVQTGRAGDPNFERNMHHHRETLPFDAFIERITAEGAGNDAYLTAYNSAQNRQALDPLNADLGFLDSYLDRNVEQPHGMMWIGPGGTFTPLHHDLTNNLLLQVVGRKQVLMLAPGETPRLYNDHHVYSQIQDIAEPGLVNRFPKLAGATVHRVMLEPGDALFIPLGWWHQVKSLDFSVSITHTNFRWPNDFHQNHPSWGA